MSDPLAGKRAEINAGERDSLMWADNGTGCPVQLGQLFPLRSCAIEITRTHRVRKGRDWYWRAEFRRVHTDNRPLYLHRVTGYTHDERQAMPAPELKADAPAEARGSGGWGVEVPEHERPDLSVVAEPEAVQPHEVADLSASREARQRYEQAQAEAAAAFAALPLSERVRRLELLGGRQARRQLRAIRAQVAEGEKRAGIRGTAA